MDKVFNQAKDKNVAGVKLYTKSEDVYLYTHIATGESDTDIKVTKEELEDAYLKGMFIVTATGYVKPVVCTTSTTLAPYTAVSYYDGTSLVTMYSKEYTAPVEEDAGQGAG